MRRLPKASNCACESQISLNRNFPLDSKATWNLSPSGSQSPDFSRRRIVSSYCSAVTEVGVNRTSMLVARSSIVVGVADVGLVAMRWPPSYGCLLTELTYSRTRLTALAWRSRILSQKGTLNVSRFSRIGWVRNIGTRLE